MDTEDLTSRVEEWSSRLQDEIDTDKATSEAVNTFLVVAAFIAGVQAQVLSFILPLPRSALQRSANFFAFLGLVFEIAGTFLGAVHSILLQRRSRNKSLRLQRVALFKADLKAILKWYTKKMIEDGQRDERQIEEGSRRAPFTASSPAVANHVNEVIITGATFNAVYNTILPQQINDNPDSEDDRKERLYRVDSFFQEIQYYPLSSSQGNIISTVNNILHSLSLVPKSFTLENNAIPRQTTQLILDTIPSVVRPIFTFGSIPLISMAVGVAFLTISTILLAAASQVVSSEVWISCTAALIVVMALSLLPFSPLMLKSHSFH